jgi:hypothetical protein
VTIVARADIKVKDAAAEELEEEVNIKTVIIALMTGRRH